VVMGSASSVGKLSVPTAWTTVTSAAPGGATLVGSGWTAPVEGGTATTVAAGMPALAAADRAGYGVAPRYGVKPRVMPTQLLG
jgi:hypothetical protein